MLLHVAAALCQQGVVCPSVIYNVIRQKISLLASGSMYTHVGCDSAGLRQLASVGCHGKWKQNVERDLMNWVRKAVDIGVEVSFVDVPIKSPVKNPNGDQVVWIKHPVIFQHNLVRAIWESGPEQMKVSLLGFCGETGLEDLWTRSQNLPWARGHPAFDGRRPNWKRLLGYRTYGDAARCQKRLTNPLKFLNLSWQSLHVRGCAQGLS